VLAGRTIAGSRSLSLPFGREGTRLPGWVVPVAAVGTALTLLVPSVAAVRPTTTSGTFLAGTGGVPGGREAGRWLHNNAPPGAQLLTIGPSMANILQFYGERRAFG